MRTALTLLAVLALGRAAAADEPALTPEARAITYLAREVPAWPAENKCFSCHNSGVGARALFMAVRLGHTVPEKALQTTTRWLMQPDKWLGQREEGVAANPALVRIQFGAALQEAIEAGVVKGRRPLIDAAKMIAADQGKDGTWHVDSESLLGTPTTLGPTLATSLARLILPKADAKTHAEAIRKGDRWLRQVTVRNVPDAAAVVMALDGADDEAAVVQRNKCLEVLRKSQDRKGGWGPDANSAPEPFDTGLALLALVRHPKEEGIKERIARGREYLIATQEKEGNWPETTRPAGAVSYAQRIATTGWVLQALLATDASAKRR